MSYLCGMSPMVNELFSTGGAREPRFTCDGCGAIRIVSLTVVPPSWFIAGKAPPGWKLVRIIGDDRRDYCPDCKGLVAP